MSPLAQVTEVDHGGAVGEEVTEDHIGSPERLTEHQQGFMWAGESIVPDRGDIPSPRYCRLAYSRSKEAIASSHNEAFFHT